VILHLHSSAGRYGADRQLALIVEQSERPALVWVPMDGPLVADLKALGAEVEIRPLPVLRRADLGPRALPRLLKARRAFERPAGVDLVHANTSVILAPADVVHVREIYPERAWPLLRAAHRNASTILCVSEAVAKQFSAAGDSGVRPPSRTPLRLWGHTSPRVRVLHDGLAFTPHRRERAEARAALDLPADAFVAAVIGRITPWKGQALFAEALLEHPDAIGLVAGDVWPGQERHERALRETAAPLGARFRILGFREDVETVYGAADVVVVPSTKPDPLPNAALEAAAAGCCVVAAAHGGLPEIVRDRETGRLFTPGDAHALAAVLGELASNPAEATRLGAAAATDVADRFSAARFGAGLRALLA
jgi:glycosyltransferase involved in cell wall biosynthesis